MNYIWITTNFEGFHFYPKAPSEVSFLRNRHRHIFFIKIFIEVYHNDREIEFFMFKNFINKFIKNTNLNEKSCEMIADDIYNYIIQKYKNRKIIIEVSEDNENGCKNEYL